MEKFRLPVGCRFTPTDEQLVTNYLKPKNEDRPPVYDIIPEYDVYSCHPEKLPCYSQYGKQNELYFFVQADSAKSRKVRSHAARDFFWRSTGVRKTIEIKGSNTTAQKMSLALYFQSESKKKKSMKWTMEEYRLVESSSTGRISKKKKGFRLCRISRPHKKNDTTGNKTENITSELHAGGPGSPDFSNDGALASVPMSDTSPSEHVADNPSSTDCFWNYTASETNAASSSSKSFWSVDNLKDLCNVKDLTTSKPAIPLPFLGADIGSPETALGRKILASLLAEEADG